MRARILLLLSLAIFLAKSVSCNAASTIEIENVELANSLHKETGQVAGLAGKGRLTRAQEQQLHIRVKNRTNLTQASIIVRYWFIGRNLQTNKAVLMEGGQETISLAARGAGEAAKEIITKSVGSNYQEAGMQVPRLKQGALGATNDAGVKIIGHAVQVIQNGKVLSEHFSTSEMKAHIGAQGDNPAPLFEKKK